MSEHGWPDDAHGYVPDPHQGHDADLEQPEVVFPDAPVPDDDLPELPELSAWADTPDVAWDDEPPADGLPAAEPLDDGGADPYPGDGVDRGHDGLIGPVGADPDAGAETGADTPLFPPPMHVGDLPEPVDGFPWIDTGSLGAVTADTLAPASGVDSADLAAYAHADLPPGVDPWAALAGSDDPATAALARFYAPETPPGPHPDQRPG